MYRQYKYQRLIVSLVLMSFVMSQLTGCSRSFWRQHADDSTYDAMADKFSDPRWQAPRVDVLPDPRSRFFDPYDPDDEPLPPGDPAAFSYMQHADRWSGWKGWHKFGVTFSVENPQWLEPFEFKPEKLQYGPETASPDEKKDAVKEELDQDFNLNENGTDTANSEQNLVPTLENLTLADAIELSNINSRDYQTAIEDLYLRALELTFDRFQFDIRFLGLGGGRPSSRATFESVPGVRDRISFSNRFGVSQLLPTGAQWIVELANDTIWVFQGGRSTTASVISYRLTQPLLLGAGRKIVLESLTQQERNVLYETRNLARFRKEFFTDIVAGSPGFLGLINQSQVVDNQRRNIYRLVEQLELQRITASQRPDKTSEKLEQLPPNFQIPESLTDLLEYDNNVKELIWRSKTMTEEQEKQLIELSDDQKYQVAVNDIIQLINAPNVPLSVAQLESQLARSQNGLQQTERRQQDLLDQFKLQLGLPPDFQISIDESLLKPFELIDPQIYTLENDMKEYVGVWAKLEEDKPDLPLLDSVLKGMDTLRIRLIEEGVESIQADFRKVDTMLQSNSAQSNTLRDYDRLTENIARDKKLFNNTVKVKMTESTTELKNLQKIAQQKKIEPAEWNNIRIQVAELRQKFLMYSQSLQVIQIGLRVELITLESFQMSLRKAIADGLENRLDLKNERARVMDARRRVEVAANELESILDIAVEGDVRTPVGVRPFEFRGDLSSYRAGISFTAPLDQIRQRNIYRAALLDYQRARRAYMAAEDGVKFQIRQSWRQLQVLKQNFEITRGAVRINAMQFDTAVELSNAPGESKESGLDLLKALSDVLDVQNDLIGNWINYEQNRLNIYRDMGTMEIDARGVWIDPYYMKLVEKSSNRVGFPETSGPSGDKMEGSEIPPPPAPAAEPANLRGENNSVPTYQNLAKTGIRGSSTGPVRHVGFRRGSWFSPQWGKPVSWLPQLISHRNRRAVVLATD